MDNLLFDQSLLGREWLMSFEERIVLLYLLNKINPEVSLEIGTNLGGSLAPISYYSRNVYSCDVMHDKIDKDDFGNVQFCTGDSKVTVPIIIDQLNKEDAFLQFVLIDGDHSETGVKADINNILRYQPKKPLYILIHDSFNPDVRTGIIKAEWEESPYVHHIQLDFVQGVLLQSPEFNKQMWGGFALAVLLPEKREKELNFEMKYQLVFESILEISSHRI
ncbi:glycosyl transferase group 1 [Dethiobacter alkaliphilus]|uniref:Glycosyltransferase (Group 1) n=1 Tax=Dethiobacter alkaliphilus AHT 1 TaxID=555088 RepID=C0GHI5_DETAL|nr:glycosyl transferase group 1 [Dethiobacter alkaliphilus]EEG77191.1 glycosyltransferase (group 1) [Dethiobacter alkaliphilus AHT 1]